jgi:hypothetical protein
LKKNVFLNGIGVAAALYARTEECPKGVICVAPKTVFRIIVFSITLFIGTATYRIGTAQTGNGETKSKVTPPVSSNDKRSHDKGTDNAAEQWVADPERGWIRRNERSEAPKKQPATPAQQSNEDPRKAQRIFWEY